MKPLSSTAFVFLVISTDLTMSELIYEPDSYLNIRRCDDGEPWRPLDVNNTTNSKEQEDSSDLAIGSDSHEDYTFQVVEDKDGRYQSNGETNAFDDPVVHERENLVPIEKIIRVPTNQWILSPLTVPVPFEVREPFELNIPYPVKVEKAQLVPVEKIVYHEVAKPVPMKVVKEVRVPIPQPYPVFFPVYKLKLVIHPQNEVPQSTEYNEY